MPQWGNSELGWSPSGNIFMKNRAYKIMTWKWMSRWRMIFRLLLEFAALWESSIVHRRAAPSWWEVPVRQRSRFEGSLTAETGPSPQSYKKISKYPGPKLVSAHCRGVVGAGSPDSSPGARLALREKKERRKHEQNQCREPLAYHGVPLHLSAGISISRVYRNVSCCGLAQNQRQTNA